jgi:CubicO group peptidase (beta-lactamase class C family)
MNDIQVAGEVAPGFESLKVLFTQQMRTLAEENAQLCVYHRGKKVVDLWASAPGNEAFSGDSLVNIFSSGKSLEAIAIGALVSRGFIDYDAPLLILCATKLAWRISIRLLMPRTYSQKTLKKMLWAR